MTIRGSVASYPLLKLLTTLLRETKYFRVTMNLTDDLLKFPFLTNEDIEICETVSFKVLNYFPLIFYQFSKNKIIFCLTWLSLNKLNHFSLSPIWEIWPLFVPTDVLLCS